MGFCPVDESREILLQVRELTVTYSPEKGSSVRALDCASIEIVAGEVVGILGESGCGKSTLAGATLQLLPPHATFLSGSVLLRERELLRLPESELRTIRGREIALIPQDPALSLNPVLTAGWQIGEALRAHSPLDNRQRRQRVIETLVEVGFDRPEDVYSAYPHQLSGGQRQRIAIAQALACGPAILIADEPTSKLDAAVQGEIITLLSRTRARCIGTDAAR